MGKSRILAAGLALLAAAVPGWALADSTITLVLGGEAFNGPPAFSVTFDGQPVGQGSVAAAIDTTKAGRFADATDKSQYTQSFSFKVPDSVFKPDGIVAVELTNEAHGTPGSRNDRELYIQSVAVNGEAIAGRDLVMGSAAGIEPTALLGDYLVVSQGAIDGIAPAPKGGWPAAAVANAQPADVPAAASAAPSIVQASAPATPAAPAPTAAATTLVSDTVDTGGNPNPEANEPECGLSKSFQIVGFNENSNDLTPRVHQGLDQVVKALDGQKCVVHLTGYSSTEGGVADNALFSIERAQNALHYLALRGVKFRRYSANGVGETTQFGSDPNANRRVVVTVSP